MAWSVGCREGYAYLLCMTLHASFKWVIASLSDISGGRGLSLKLCQSEYNGKSDAAWIKCVLSP